jgi:hypothetical protein
VRVVEQRRDASASRSRVGVFAWRLFVQIKRRLLWRVRRKLILSYIFIGVIPSLLILVFFLFAGSLVFMNVSAYCSRTATTRSWTSHAPQCAGGRYRDRAQPDEAVRDDRARPPHPSPRVSGVSVRISPGGARQHRAVAGMPRRGRAAWLKRTFRGRSAPGEDAPGEED